MQINLTVLNIDSFAGSAHHSLLTQSIGQLILFSRLGTRHTSIFLFLSFFFFSFSSLFAKTDKEGNNPIGSTC